MRSERRGRSARILRFIAMGPLAIMGCGWMAGCYEFVQVDPTSAPLGARARVELTSEGSSRMAEARGGRERSRIEGKVLEVSPDGGVLMEVAGESGPTAVGVNSRPLFARVSVPAEDLMSLELKKFKKGRTALLIGAAGVAAAVIVEAAFNISNSGDGEGGGPPVDQALIPLFSFRVGR